MIGSLGIGWVCNFSLLRNLQVLVSEALYKPASIAVAMRHIISSGQHCSYVYFQRTHHISLCACITRITAQIKDRHPNPQPLLFFSSPSFSHPLPIKHLPWELSMACSVQDCAANLNILTLVLRPTGNIHHVGQGQEPHLDKSTGYTSALCLHADTWRWISFPFRFPH